LNTDWYINQMKAKAYKSESLPISIKETKYTQGTNDIAYYGTNTGIYPPNRKEDKDPIIPLESFINCINSSCEKTTFNYRDKALNENTEMLVYPSKKFFLRIDSSKVVQSIVPDKFKNNVRSSLVWKVNNKHLMKKDLIMLDMIASINKGNWERPIYFSSTLGYGRDDFLGLERCMALEGMAYRLYPAYIGSNVVDTDIMYDNMMNKFEFTNLDKEGIHYNQDYKRFVSSMRRQYLTLAEALVKQNKYEKAIKVADKCFEAMPHEAIPFDLSSAMLAAIYLKVGEDEKADVVINQLKDMSTETLTFLNKIGSKANRSIYNNEKGLNCYILVKIIEALESKNAKDTRVNDIKDIIASSGCYSKNK